MAPHVRIELTVSANLRDTVIALYLWAVRLTPLPR